MTESIGNIQVLVDASFGAGIVSTANEYTDGKVDSAAVNTLAVTQQYTDDKVDTSAATRDKYDKTILLAWWVAYVVFVVACAHRTGAKHRATDSCRWAGCYR